MLPTEPGGETGFSGTQGLIDPRVHTDPTNWEPKSSAREPQPTIDVTLADPMRKGSVRAKALVDSGAAISLVTDRATKKIIQSQGGPLTYNKPAPDSVQGVGGAIPTFGATLLDIHATDVAGPAAQFTIVKDLPGGIDAILSCSESERLGLLQVGRPGEREPGAEPPGQEPDADVFARPGVGPARLVAAARAEPLHGPKHRRGTNRRGRRRRRGQGVRHPPAAPQWTDTATDPAPGRRTDGDPIEPADSIPARASVSAPRAARPRGWRADRHQPETLTRSILSELAELDAEKPQRRLIAAMKHSNGATPTKALPHINSLLGSTRNTAAGGRWTLAAHAAFDMLEDADTRSETSDDEDDDASASDEYDNEATSAARTAFATRKSVASTRLALLAHVTLGQDNDTLRHRLVDLRDAITAHQAREDEQTFGALALSALTNEQEGRSKLQAAREWIETHSHQAHTRVDPASARAVGLVADILRALYKDHTVWDRVCTAAEDHDGPLASARRAYRRARVALVGANLTAAEALANGLSARGPLAAAHAAREALDVVEREAVTCPTTGVTIAMNLAAARRIETQVSVATVATTVEARPEVDDDGLSEEDEADAEDSATSGLAPGRIMAPLKYPLVFGADAWGRIQADPQSAALAHSIGELAAENDRVELWKDMQVVNEPRRDVPLPSEPLFRPHISDEAHAALREHMGILESYGCVERVDAGPSDVPGWYPRATSPDAPVAFIPTFVIVIPGKKPRVIADARAVNRALAPLAPPASINTPALINKLADPDCYRSSMDLTKAYPQIGTSRTKGIQCYLTDPRGGWWLSRSLLTGGISSPGALNSYIMAKLSAMDPELRKYVDVYADNIFASSPMKLSGNPEGVRLHLRVIQAIFMALNAGPHAAKITLEEKGSTFMVDSMPVLGFDVSDAGAALNPDRLVQLQAYRLEFPTTFRRLRTLLGRLAYINNYIPRLASLCQRLQPPQGRMNTGKIASFAKSSPEAAAWMAGAEAALHEAVDMIERAPPMAARNRALRPALFTDGARWGKGCVLCDIIEELPGDDDGKCEQDVNIPGRFRLGKLVLQVVHVASAVTAPAQQHHSAPILELRALLWGLHKMKNFWAGHVPIVFTDSTALAGQVSGASESHMALRTLEALDELGAIEVRHVKGEYNPADIWSRLPEQAIGAFTLNAEVLLKHRLTGTTPVAAVTTRARAGAGSAGPLPRSEPTPAPTPEPHQSDRETDSDEPEPKTRVTSSMRRTWTVERTRAGAIVPPVVASGNINPRWTLGEPGYDPEDADLRNEVLRTAHSYAHEGVDGTTRRVRRDGFSWSSIVRDTRALIADCKACVINTVGKALIAPATVFTNEKTFPNDVIHIDTMFFSHEANGTGESRAVIIIDRFSGYIAVYPVPAVNSESAANALREWISSFGAPTTVVADGGSEFQGAFEQLLTTRGIKVVHGVPFNKSSNSIAESAIKVLRGYARKISNGDFHSWIRDCKDAASAHNSRGSEFLSNTSPAEVFLGRRIDLNGRRPDIEHHFANAEREEAAQRTAVLRALTEQAAHRVIEYRDARTRDAEDRLSKIEKHLEHHGPPTPLEVGQLVVIKVPIKKYKMQPAYSWPPQIIANVSKLGTITLLKTDRTGPDENRKYRPHDLKIYTGTDPGAQFVVADVLEARWSHLWDDNNVKLPPQIMYKVRWAGFKAQDDSWQVEADLPSSEHWKERMATLRAKLPKTGPRP